MLIRISSKHFLHVQSTIDFDNELSVICHNGNNTSMEDNEHMMTNEIDKIILNESDDITENNYPIDLRIPSKKKLSSNEIPIIFKASKSSINMLNSNELNNEQSVSYDVFGSSFFHSNFINLPQPEKINLKCLNSIIYTEESERYYCPNRFRGRLPIISSIRITDNYVKLPKIEFQSQRNCHRRQKRALRKGKHINSCKFSSTTDLNK